MSNKVTVREVRRLFLRNLGLKSSQLAWIFKDMLKNSKPHKLAFSRRAEKMMRQKIKELEEAAKWENFPRGNI